MINQVFFQEKMVLDRKTNSFPGKRWLWTRKPIFPRKTKTTKHKDRNFMAKLRKDEVLAFTKKELVSHTTTMFFSWDKVCFFTPKPILPKETLVFLPKTILFIYLEKVGFPIQNHLFPGYFIVVCD